MDDQLRKKLGTSIIGQAQMYILRYVGWNDKLKAEVNSLKKKIKELENE